MIISMKKRDWNKFLERKKIQYMHSFFGEGSLVEKILQIIWGDIKISKYLIFSDYLDFFSINIHEEYLIKCKVA